MSILRGDCIEVMRTLEADSIDAIVTDPPYGLSFMGRPWDDLGELREFGRWCERWAGEAIRVLKPGGHLLAFGGSRTYHRLAAGIEDAGFEIRDQLMWIYASGFPKSLDVSKAIDKAAGAEREIIHEQPYNSMFSGPPDSSGSHIWTGRLTSQSPATDAAREWSGWGTALKPAHEPIVLARKPLVGTVAANVQVHGTGALNIDGCRIAYISDNERSEVNRRSGPNSRYREQVGGGVTGSMTKLGERHTEDVTNPLGRWPANVVLTDPVFDGGWEGVVGGGEAGGGYGRRGKSGSPNIEGWGYRQTGEVVGYGDTGTYSRFFLVPKAPRRERVLRDGRRSPHPTQKPEQLIRHLVTMVTPPGGIVLDPFLGSGTLGVVCEDIGVRWLGIEREAEYADWARDRLADRQPEWVKAEEEMC